MARTASRILGFDGLRAIAFLLVFVSHKAPSAETGAYGMSAVWIFFVLSGFLITGILARLREDIENASSTFKASIVDFYIRRTGRIFPPYYALLFVIALLAALGLVSVGARSAFLSNWLFLSNVYIAMRWWPDALGHLWSLSVEEQFYLLFAPIALTVPRPRLGLVCVIVLFLSAAVDIGAYLYGVDFITFSVASSVNFGLFALGGLAVLAASRPLPRWLGCAPATWINVALISAAPFLMSNPNDEFLLTHGRPLGLLFALLLLQIAQSQSSVLVRALDWTPLRRLGVISYGAYLYHYPLSSASILAGLGLGAAAKLWLTMPLDLFLTIVVATVSYRYLEQPIRNWSRRTADARVSQAADASASRGTREA